MIPRLHLITDDDFAATHARFVSSEARLSARKQAMIREFPERYKMYSIREFTFNGIRQHNRNRLLWRDASVDGIKTGQMDRLVCRMEGSR